MYKLNSFFWKRLKKIFVLALKGLRKLREFYKFIFEVLIQEYGSTLIVVIFLTVIVLFINNALTNIPFGQQIGMINYIILLITTVVLGVIRKT